MQILDASFDLAAFQLALRTDSRKRILFLDYDGTLAPFTADRDNARPYPGVCDVLSRVQRSGRTRLVIVSGRKLDDLPRLLGLQELPELWGSHGWERRTAEGVYSKGEVPGALSLAMDEAVLLLRERGLHAHLETKPMSVALHWRDAAPAEIEPLREVALRWQAIAVGVGLDLHAFDGGVELRVLGRNKAYAVHQVMSEEANPGPVAYLGDDKTDEDAFSALRSGDLGVLVREISRPTGAKVWLRPPGELLEFLAQFG